MHNDQMYYSLAVADYARHPQWLNQYADAVVKTSDSSIYSTIGGTIFTGATGGLGAVATPLMAGATAVPRVGSIAEYLLTTRMGAGATNATFNVASQLIQADDAHPFRITNVAASFATGFAGVNGGFIRNVAISTATGAANAQVNNWIYASSNDSWMRGAATSGGAGGAGYLVSDKFGGLGKAGHMQRLGPVVLGNAIGAGATELAGWIGNGPSDSSPDREKRP